MILTLLSILVSRVFVSLTLVLIVNLNDTLGYVLRSITKYKYHLIFAYIFGLIGVYIFTFIAFIKYSNGFMVGTADGTGFSPKDQNELIGYNDLN
jgi:hypothetical protein